MDIFIALELYGGGVFLRTNAALCLYFPLKVPQDCRTNSEDNTSEPQARKALLG